MDNNQGQINNQTPLNSGQQQVSNTQGQMVNNQVQSNIKENERKGRGLFYGVVAVATFIVMAVGATFAYFTASTSSGSTTVNTKSASVNLKFISYNTGWMSENLIPASTNTVGYSFQEQNDTTPNDLCKDDQDRSICSVYVFQIYNSDNGDLTVNIDVESTDNQFANLRALMYEVSLPSDLTTYSGDSNNNGTNDPKFKTGAEDPETIDESFIDVQDIRPDGSNLTLNLGDDFGTTYQPIFINRAGVTKTLLNYNDTENAGSTLPSINLIVPSTVDEFGNPLELSETAKRVRVADSVNIYGRNNFMSSETFTNSSSRRLNTFALVLYVYDTGTDQTAIDADKSFSGRIIVSPADGSSGGVSGSISAATGFNFGLGSDDNTGGTPTQP